MLCTFFCTRVYLYISAYISYIYCTILPCRRPKNNSIPPTMAKSKTCKQIYLLKKNYGFFSAFCITAITIITIWITLSKYCIQISTTTTGRCRCWHQISTKFNFLISIQHYSLHSRCQRVKPTNGRTCQQVNCRKFKQSIGRKVELAATVRLTAAILLAALGFRRGHNGTGLTALGRVA